MSAIVQCHFKQLGLLTVNRFFCIQLWNVASGSCYVTFTEHTNSITAVLFLPTNHVVVSASLDGTVRAYDLVRYRNFRTFTTPKPAQFVSLAADQSGEILCAGSLDGFQVQLKFPFEGLLQHLPQVCGGYVVWGSNALVKWQRQIGLGYYLDHLLLVVVRSWTALLVHQLEFSEDL